MSSTYNGVIDRYRANLPKIEDRYIVSLNEGNTPLVEVPRLAKALGAPQISLYLKLEGLNPTGSFKDRGMTVAISQALQEGSKAVICGSTGNTSASAAAYAARAGMKCVVLIPEGNIALGKLSQALMHGAQVLAVQGNFDEALELVKRISGSKHITMVNSLNPMRIEGQKTGSFEIIDTLGKAPDYQFMPVGNAGNITAYWMGYKEYVDKRKAASKPKMMGFQAEGAAPIVRGEPVKNPKTVATAIKIGNPASWKKAEAARDESGGVIDMVSDEEILEAYKMMASIEGIFCEPASAAGVAGLKKYIAQKKFKIEKGTSVVCIITGHGLKDPDCAMAIMPKPKSIKPDVNDILRELNL
ncbi:MAG: threonine synthase [Elusimicrobia bacterium]|nr:threonine synthase [Candidatus Obscuribacterium magneticum]